MKSKFKSNTFKVEDDRVELTKYLISSISSDDISYEIGEKVMT